ncbi:phosphatidylethanolamine N-methyltransferase [Bufo gargarizans]|uniref:phosphatidylethanolamine N-methyltransferase n=1 Tax=Bufo gargarizans TaxID=30331 RepID=UPI001CF4AECD|nr:phosphatidylethanolamine N-methyltransferase [Bufo gargarizans]
MADLSRYVELTEYNFLFATACILFNPLFWNVVARWEYRTRTLSRTFGSPYVACYILGAVLIFLAIFRSHCFSEAMSHQPHWWILKRPEFYYLGVALVASGAVLVVSSFLALGFAGTYLGDYFGILMEEKVTGFPFNVMENPMYWGSTANYLGLALLNSSPAGLALTAVVALCYKVAIWFEGPFTEKIYRNKEKSKRSH